MKILLLIALYLIGVGLNYLRMTGFVYGLEEKSIKKYNWKYLIRPVIQDGDDLFFLLKSWIGFIQGTGHYFTDRKDKYFFKLSLSGLKKYCVSATNDSI